MKTADKQARTRIEEVLARNEITPSKGGTVTAYVNHDRWVADCPCNGAELVAPGETMLCGGCGAEHKVAFPKNRVKVEELLAARPATNRNWNGEPVDELLAENIENGIWEG